jgi:hypothetical protein
VEIANYYPQQSAAMETGPEDRVTVARQSATQTPQGQEIQASSQEDRVDLVTIQNQVSPLEQQTDVQQALGLLSQFKDGLGQQSREELGQLYNFDRLRDLLLQVQQPLSS